MPPELDGVRADVAVARLAEISRAAARRAVRAGDVVLADGTAVTAAARLQAGATIAITLASDEALAAEAVPFGVVWEDDHMAAVSKPAGVVVHPGAGVVGGTLAAGLLQRWPQIRGVGDPGREGIVHRLDRDTSGVMLVAKTAQALEGLRAQMRDRSVDRRYRALVRGRLDFATGTVDAPLRRDAANPTKIAVAADGRPARTHYTLEAEWDDASLLRVRLETGRTHQIRVHMAAIGHPVVGDPVYGTPAAERMFLHAASVSWRHPVSGEELAAEDPLPPELATVLASLGQPKKARATS